MHPSSAAWWSDVAAGFTGEHLEDLERAVLPLVGADEARLLRPHLQARHDAVVAQVEALPWRDELTTADIAFNILVAAVPASDDGGDVPFTRIIAGIESPEVASSFAQRWWRHLAIAHIDDEPRSGTAFTVAAYTVAACEGLLHVQGKRSVHDVLVWLQTAARHVEVEHGDGVDLGLILRAARLLQPVLERARIVER